MARWIRWKAVVPVVVLILLITIFVVFFLDSVVKWAIVRSGQAVFGAKVEVASVDLKVRRSSLTVRGLQVADKSDPWKNLFQFDQAVFDARVLPLLEKRVILDQMAMTGLKFGTARKTSGELPFVEKRPGFVGKAVDRLWSQVETISLDKFDNVKKYYDPKTVVNPDQLTSIKAAQDAKEKLQKTPDEVKKEIDSLEVEKRLADLRKRAEALGQGKSEAADILRKVEEGKSIQSDLQKLRQDIEKTKASVGTRVQGARSMVDDVKKAKDEDLKRLRATLSLPTLDQGAIARALFGPSVSAKLEKVLGWVQTGRQYMPAKAQAPPPPPRGKGRTIEFPKHNILPRFLLVKGQVSGEVGHEQPFGFSGTIGDITSNPELWGKPATLNFHGEQGARAFIANVLMDHRQQPSTDSFDGRFNGFPLSNLTFGQANSLGLLMEKGVGSVSGGLKVQGDAIGGRVNFQAGNLTLHPQLDVKKGGEIVQRLTTNITSSLSQVKQLGIGVNVGGTLASPTLDIDSNVGSVVAGAMKNALGAEVARQEQALRAELDRQTNAKIQELSSAVDKLSNDALGRLGSQDKAVQALLDRVKQQIAGGAKLPGKGLDSIKGIFGR